MRAGVLPPGAGGNSAIEPGACIELYQRVRLMLLHPAAAEWCGLRVSQMTTGTPSAES